MDKEVLIKEIKENVKFKEEFTWNDLLTLKNLLDNAAVIGELRDKIGKMFEECDKKIKRTENMIRNGYVSFPKA